MTEYKLSILIPARNEMFVAKTVEDLLSNIEGDTEIIVGLDGAWADPGIPDHPRVTVFYSPEALGQRGMTNALCRLSKAKYVMKVDAHTAWDKGFDVKLMADMQDDWTQVPVMRNLHAFNWVCEDGHTRYQGPSGNCTECGKPTTRDVVWIAKSSPQSTSFRFDTKMHFQYFGEWKKKQKGDLVESLSLQGSCFMLTREKYWELNICDESWGSWGQQGVEVAVKTWLSGGKVICNKKTWYAHMFRTQGGDFSFPYKQRPESEIVALREMTKDLFTNNKWDKATKTFQWLLDKFAPLDGWHNTKQDKDIGDSEPLPDAEKKGIIFFTDNRLNLKIAHAVQKQLKKIGLPIVSSSLKPMGFGDKNVVIDGKRGYHTYFKQIVAALETLHTEFVFFCEHDVLYPPSHFEFTPPTNDKFYYNQNWVKAEYKDGKFTGRNVAWDADQVSGLVCNREYALAHYKKILDTFDEEKFNRSFEPGSGTNSEAWRSKEPYVDIRQENTLTRSKWSLADFRDKKTAKNFKEVTMPEWATDKL